MNFNQRWKQGLGELLPQAFFYLTQAVMVMSLFRNINGFEIPQQVLIQFLLLLFAIDSLNDAFLYKGLFEYVLNLRRGQIFYYILGPKNPLVKVIFLRVELPMFFQGVVFTFIYLGYTLYNLIQTHAHIHLYDIFLQTLILAVILCLGVVVNLVLTSAYFIIQSYFDPLIPIPMGSPATRYYTRPIHLIIQNSFLMFILKWIYPAYFITGFASSVSNLSVDGLSILLSIIALVSILLIWINVLNHIIIKACQKHQA